MITRLPHVLILFRLIAGCTLPLLASIAMPCEILATFLLLGFLSDVCDGMIARRLSTDTLPLRRLDTRCDLIFFAGAALASMIANPASIAPWFPWIWGYLVLFILRNLVDFLRYRASPSYHMWSGKIWSVVIFFYVFTALLGFTCSPLQPIAFCLYALNAAEGIAASLILSSPGKDIPSIWHVFQHRKRYLRT